MTKVAGSGSISQRHGFENPDPDPQNTAIYTIVYESLFLGEVAIIIMLADGR